MKDINLLFFQLIRVAIGTQDTLLCSPSAEEWKTLYDIAKKQSLVGICFAGVQRLPEDARPPEILYLTWMGMAAKIQQRNQVVDKQCFDFQKRLSADGLRSSILKGQGVAASYRLHDNDDDNHNHNHNHDLGGLRQSGDIDIFVAGGMEKVLGYCTEKFGKVEWDYINAHAPFFPDTEVEMHWRVQAMTNLFANRRLQKWLKREDVKDMMFGGKAVLGSTGSPTDSLVVPTVEFNAFYILLHCYHHMFESGLGLRQLMDYYFVLLSLERELPRISRNLDVNALYEEFGMKRFAKGVMWIMKDVFGLKDECLLCEADEREGKFLLNEVMQNGNFGHHDERVKKVGSGKMQFLLGNVQHNLHLATHYPSESFWAPVWLIYHYFWKRTNKNKI